MKFKAHYILQLFYSYHFLTLCIYFWTSVVYKLLMHKLLTLFYMGFLVYVITWGGHIVPADFDL